MKRIAAVLVAVVLAASIASAQRRGRFFGPQVGANPKYDGAFQFCRIYFRNASNGDGGGWGVDYPRADENLTFRLSELTSTLVSQDVGGNYNHVVANLTDALTISRCPFTMLTEPGGAYRPKRGRRTARLSRARRLSVGRRFLGRVRVGSLGERAAKGAAERRVHDPGSSYGAPDFSRALRRPRAAADPVD
jgi:hypothetical protein